MKYNMWIMVPNLGDDHVEWETDDPKSIEKAKKKFDDAVAKGHKVFKAVKKTVAGERITEFDPTLGDMLIIPQLAGG